MVHGGVSEINRLIFASTPAEVKRGEIGLSGAEGVITGHSGVSYPNINVDAGNQAGAQSRVNWFSGFQGGQDASVAETFYDTHLMNDYALGQQSTRATGFRLTGLEVGDYYVYVFVANTDDLAASYESVYIAVTDAAGSPLLDEDSPQDLTDFGTALRVGPAQNTVDHWTLRGNFVAKGVSIVDTTDWLNVVGYEDTVVINGFAVLDNLIPLTYLTLDDPTSVDYFDQGYGDTVFANGQSTVQDTEIATSFVFDKTGEVLSITAYITVASGNPFAKFAIYDDTDDDGEPDTLLDETEKSQFDDGWVTLAMANSPGPNVTAGERY
ncbi:MAG: hypothetical protein IH960_12435, partial [Chloroflexi bacterium]|nr:hypothetical protein [Chloroflexota bacterium]